METGEPPSVTVRTRSRGALIAGWLLSLVLAAGLGWMVGRFGFPGEFGAGGDGASPVTRADLSEQAAPGDEQPPERTGASVDPGPAPAARQQVVDAPPSPAPVEENSTAPEPQPVDEPPAVVELSGAELTAAVDRVDRLFENGDLGEARTAAERLLAPFGSYTGLVAALVEGGAVESGAQLHAVRVLQAAGHDSISRELARELKRSYTGTRSVADSIWNWGVLSPRILSTESRIERGRTVVVLGTLENPDIGVVRRVQVEVEALDAAGNRLAAVELRVRPRVIGAGETADFSASFKGLDPASVISTRATVLKWESEVLSPG